MRNFLILIFTLTFTALPAYAQKSPRDRVNYVRTVSAQYDWICTSYATQTASGSQSVMTIKTLSGNTVHAKLQSLVKLDGRNYVNRTILEGWLDVARSGGATLYLFKEISRQNDALPSGYYWPAKNSIRFDLKVFDESALKPNRSAGKVNFSLRGKSTDDFGTTDVVCFPDTQS